MKSLQEYVDDLKVLYEDNHIIVLIKPSNVLSQKDNTNDVDMNEIVKEYLKKKYNKPGNVYLGLVHRLDRRVEGVMVFAKTSKAAMRLSKDFKDNNLKKKYYAVVYGKVAENATLKNYLYKDEEQRIARIVSSNYQGAKEAILNYNILKYISINNITHTILDVELITGRYNQIRCQLAYINHPILNDYKYGYSKDNGNIGLYCYSISMHHPVTKEIMVFNYIPNNNLFLQ